MAIKQVDGCHKSLKFLRVEYHLESPSANTNMARSVTHRHILVEFLDSRDVSTFVPFSSAIKGQDALGTMSFSYPAYRGTNISKLVSSSLEHLWGPKSRGASHSPSLMRPAVPLPVPISW